MQYQPDTKCTPLNGEKLYIGYEMYVGTQCYWIHFVHEIHLFGENTELKKP